MERHVRQRRHGRVDREEVGRGLLQLLHGPHRRAQRRPHPDREGQPRLQPRIGQVQEEDPRPGRHGRGQREAPRAGGGLPRVGLEGRGPRGHARRHLQQKAQPRRPARLQRRLPLAAGHVSRHPAQEAPARRRGAHHPGRRGHADRARGRRRQDLHRHRRHARAQAPGARPQADDRCAEQPHRAVGRRLPQALPRREAARPHGRRGEEHRLRATLLGAGRRGRLGRRHRRLQPLREATDVLCGAEGRTHGAHRRARGIQADGTPGRRRREGLLGQADRGRARQVQEQAPVAREAKRVQDPRRRDFRGDRLRRAVRRRGPLLQEPRGVGRLGAGHADERRRQVRGPSDEVRIPPRQRTRQQHRVRHGHARHEHDGRALQTSARGPRPSARSPRPWSRSPRAAAWTSSAVSRGSRTSRSS